MHKILWGTMCNSVYWINTNTLNPTIVCVCVCVCVCVHALSSLFIGSLTKTNKDHTVIPVQCHYYDKYGILLKFMNCTSA